MSRFAALGLAMLGGTFLAVVATGQVVAAGSQQRKELFQTRCGGCHSLDADKVGPRLRGVFGRPVGSIQSFNYSDAARSSHVKWDETALDKWLAEPDSVIPNSDMSFRLENGRERTAIIEYLKHLHPK